MESIKQKQIKVRPELMRQFGLKNVMAVPKLAKLTVNVGIGSRRDKSRIELVSDRLTKITGQKPATRGAKKAIATFKTRQGDIIGLTTTLRGERMFGFLDKVLHVALPRTRDFRGLSLRGVDPMGNYTFGIREHTIFPETADEDVKDVFGLAITVGTTAGNKAHAEALLRALGFPFKKVEEGKEAKAKKKSKSK